MTQVSGLEAIVQELNLSKQTQFETLESRQSEVDNARAQMEAMQNSTKELEFQLRETTERCSLLEDQLNSASNSRSDARGRLTANARSARDTPSPSPSRQNSYDPSSAGEVQRLLAEAEARAEVKMSDLRHKIRSLENERNDAEEEWSNKLQERARESEKLRRAIAEKDTEYNDVLRTSREKEERIGEAEERRKGLERELNALKAKVEEAKGDISTSADAEVSIRCG
jgi:predicted  nucleic acid-binding Zn-ribbon protein